MATNSCCAECGEEGGVGLKTCKSCKLVKYCNAECQKKHWATHKADCKRRTAELRDEALFKDPPPKEECPICFLPMPATIISCASLPPATISSIPINDFAIANVELATMETEKYYSCCGKIMCTGCVHSSYMSGNDKCPFCNADQMGKTRDEQVEDNMKRVEANDAFSICMLADSYYHGLNSFQQDQTKGMELYTRAANLGCRQAHHHMADIYQGAGILKKAKFHYEAAAMAGNEAARNSLGCIEFESENIERAMKHWTIGASAGGYIAMHHLRICFEKGHVSRESMNSTLANYNASCAEMRSEARDAYIRNNQ